jgi:hypothetical protein
MFTIKFTLKINKNVTSVTFKTKSLDTAVREVVQHPDAKVYKGVIPTNLHTLRYYGVK